MNQKRIVQKYMTHLPVQADASSSLETIQELMREHGIRHIPVKSGLDIVGMVSDRDIKFARAAWQQKASDLQAKQIMTDDVFRVGPLDSLSEVAEQMERRKLGSAVVMDGGVMVGIFTTTDALKALKELA